MAYVEVWKNQRLVLRRHVDEQKAGNGCNVRLGSAGEVHIAAGQSKTLGEFTVRMYDGDPPETQRRQTDRDASKPQDEITSPLPLDFSKGAADSNADEPSAVPEIEGYRIIERLGHGGMGTVWRAEQLSTRREVALKLMSAAQFGSEKAQTRFEREVELTARLDHPNIARVYDSGLRHGMYYYAMELIDGMPLDRYVRSKSLSNNQILVLVQKVCQAVLYAHLRAVVHRDLKPSNILVDSDGRPHVLDFGLAKALLEDDEALTISVEGQIAGTPAYMSPEQAAGHHNQTDTRTDVFSLGVILYELLTGQPPHDRTGSMIDLLNRISEGKVKRPREINKSIDSELEAILLKSLAVDPDKRYASAGALAKDIASYLDEEPLDAIVPTTFYFLRKKASKYRVQAAAFMLILVVIIIAYSLGVRTITLRSAINRALDFNDLSWGELEDEASGSDPEDTLAALRVLRDRYIEARQENSQLTHKLKQRKPPVAVRRIDLQRGNPLTSTALVRTPSLPGAITSWTLETYGHRGRIISLVYSPDGSRLASAGHDGTIRIWDSDSGKLVHVLIDPNTMVSNLAWSEDGKCIQGTAASDPLLKSFWEIEPDRIRPVGNTPDDTKWQNSSGKCWSVGLQAPAKKLDEISFPSDIPLLSTWALKRLPITALAYTPERKQLACGGEDGTLRILDSSSGKALHNLPATWCGPINSIDLSPDGQSLATYSAAGTLCLWQANRWEPLGKFEAESIRHVTDVRSEPLTASQINALRRHCKHIAWAPDNSHIARADNSRMIIEILDLSSGDVVRELSGSNGSITCVSWSSDGRLITAGTEKGQVILWDLESELNEPAFAVIAHDGAVSSLDWMPKSRSLITTGRDGMIRILDTREKTLTDTYERPKSPINCAALSRDGNYLAACGADELIRLWNTDGWTSNLLRIDPNDDEGQYDLTAVAWSPDGESLAFGDSVGKVRIYDLNSRKWRQSLVTVCGSVSSLAWTDNGRILLCGGTDGIVRAWDATTDFKEHVMLLPLQGQAEPGIAVSAAGDYRGPPRSADQIVYAVQTKKAQLTLSTADFKSKYGWINEPWQVGLYEPGKEAVERIYVNSKSEGPHDGKTWSTAFNDLQDALSTAGPDTEIWVAAGVYKPDRGTGARTASFHLKNGVRLLGGFTGTETSSDQRDPNSNETILSGDLKGDDDPNFVKNDENSYHVVVAIRTDLSTVLDGFTITGGNANGPGESQRDEGGGIHSVDGGMTLVGCTFRFNASTRPGAGMRHGSGRSALFLTNCVFRNNRARVKEGHDWGGGISIWGATGKMENCRFENNEASSGGAVFLSGTVNFVVKDCTFIGNRATGGSGALHAWAEDKYSLINCRFVRNSARFHAGAVTNEGDSKATLVNCVFIGNRSRHGAGGMSHYPGRHGSGTARLTNCTFVGNNTGAEAGSAFFGGEHGSALRNCIVWSNTDWSESQESSQVSGDGILIDHCCIQGWIDKLGGTSNFGQNPLFVDIDGPDNMIGNEDDDLRLSPDSPCINSGDNSLIPPDSFDLDGDGDPNEPIPFDFDGKPRILNGTVDIGAFESG